MQLQKQMAEANSRSSRRCNYQKQMQRSHAIAVAANDATTKADRSWINAIAAAAADATTQTQPKQMQQTTRVQKQMQRKLMP
jgi:hypothetical protein